MMNHGPSYFTLSQTNRVNSLSFSSHTKYRMRIHIRGNTVVPPPQVSSLKSYMGCCVVGRVQVLGVVGHSMHSSELRIYGFLLRTTPYFIPAAVIRRKKFNPFDEAGGTLHPCRKGGYPVCRRRTGTTKTSTTIP